MPIPHMFDASFQLAAISTQDFAEDPSQASRSKKARSGSDATFTRSVEIKANLTVGTAPRGADACGVFVENLHSRIDGDRCARQPLADLLGG